MNSIQDYVMPVVSAKCFFYTNVSYLPARGAQVSGNDIVVEASDVGVHDACQDCTRVNAGHRAGMWHSATPRRSGRR